jgi:two-component system CheB/CheR fusion protein
MTPERKGRQKKRVVGSQRVHDELERRVRERTAELVRSNEALRAEITERKRIEKEILEAAQEEQRRFGSQLHDGLCQELTGILMFAKGLTQKMEREHRIDVAELKKITDLLREAISQARDTARGLYPGEMEGTSLMHSLQELTSNTQRASGVACMFFCPESIIINDNDVATHLYRIAQEGISNAVEHGRAQSIEVSFTQNDGRINLTLKDDGSGFVSDPMNPKGIGLKIMKYRAHMMGGIFQIKPNSPQGVVLQCSLKSPLN